MKVMHPCPSTPPPAGIGLSHAGRNNVGDESAPRPATRGLAGDHNYERVYTRQKAVARATCPVPGAVENAALNPCTETLDDFELFTYSQFTHGLTAITLPVPLTGSASIFVSAIC